MLKLSNNSINNIDQFCDIPPLPKRIIDILTYPEPYKAKWMEAINKEMNGIVIEKQGLTACTEEYMKQQLLNNTLSYVLNILPVFKIKLDQTYKVRFTLDGRLQRRFYEMLFGTKSKLVVNFSSPSVCPEVLRIMLWLCVQYPKHLCTTKSIDYSQAYLNSKRKETDAEVFVRLPPGILIDGEKQAKANIHFYGELDAGLRWFENLTDSIIARSKEMGYPIKQNETDPTFYHFFSALIIILILANVDDLILHIIGENSEQVMDELISKMKQDYKLTISPNINQFLGLNLTWDVERAWVKISMENKIDELTELLNLKGRDHVQGPMPKNFDNTPLSPDHINYHEPFPTIYGKFLFISHYRPDAAIAKTKLAPFMHKWSKYHWETLIHLCTYLMQTRDHGMYLQRSEGWQVNKTKCEVISDAGELANTNSYSKSIIGHVLIIEGNIISFRSKNTSCVTVDAAHAELMGLYAATKVTKFMDNLFLSMHPITLAKPIRLYGDNLASLWISRTKGNSTRTKHYNVKLHYIYEQITKDLLETKHIDTKECIADFLTKIQEQTLFIKHIPYFVAKFVHELIIFSPPITDKSDISKKH